MNDVKSVDAMTPLITVAVGRNAELNAPRVTPQAARSLAAESCGGMARSLTQSQ